MTSETQRNMVIRLEDSLYAHGFEGEYQIHENDIQRALSLIRKRVEAIREKSGYEYEFFLSHNYHTIGVFGERGSGKTSFLISLLQRCQSDAALRNDVAILSIIDPTLIEHKKPIILSIIASVNALVDSHLKSRECGFGSEVYEFRKQWEAICLKLAEGVIAIEKVGSGYEDSLWHDDAYVFNTGFSKVEMSNRFEENLRRMFELALRILGDKKAFVIAFDDIDVDLEAGWEVLETLRRYLSCKNVISIVSGDLKLYSMIVRSKLSGNLRLDDPDERNRTADELESQYLLKLLKTSNRIHLESLRQLSRRGFVGVVRESARALPLKNTYMEIVHRFGIKDLFGKANYCEFLMSMSLRSQIHFMLDATSSDPHLSQYPFDVFTPRLYNAGIDLESLRCDPLQTNIAVLKLMLKIGRLGDCYQMLPTTSDRNINSCLTALSLLECRHFRNNPESMFDFMLRIGYNRNMLMRREDPEDARAMCRFAGWDQWSSLKNNVSMSMAYREGRFKEDRIKECVPLFSLKKKAKRPLTNSLDSVLGKEKDGIKKLLAMLPYVRISHTYNNMSGSYYSPFVMLAVIGDILRCNNREMTAIRLNNLKLFRSYPAPSDSKEVGESENVEVIRISGLDVDEASLFAVAELLETWRSKRPEDAFLPPYVLGRIMTRFFTAAENIKIPKEEHRNAGHMMNVLVAIFLNACIIEEANSGISLVRGTVNNNNPVSTATVFYDNLKRIVKEVKPSGASYDTALLDALPFSKWMLECPLLYCFLNPEDGGYDRIEKILADDGLPSKELSIYDLLKKIDVKVSDDQAKNDAEANKIAAS